MRHWLTFITSECMGGGAPCIRIGGHQHNFIFVVGPLCNIPFWNVWNQWLSAIPVVKFHVKIHPKWRVCILVSTAGYAEIATKMAIFYYILIDKWKYLKYWGLCASFPNMWGDPSPKCTSCPFYGYLVIWMHVLKTLEWPNSASGAIVWASTHLGLIWTQSIHFLKCIASHIGAKIGNFHIFYVAI